MIQKNSDSKPWLLPLIILVDLVRLDKSSEAAESSNNLPYKGEKLKLG